MASGMTKTQLVRHLAEKIEVNNKTAAAFLENLTDTAVQETKKNGIFVIPGLYVSFQTMREKMKGAPKVKPATEPASH